MKTVTYLHNFEIKVYPDATPSDVYSYYDSNDGTITTNNHIKMTGFDVATLAGQILPMFEEINITVDPTTVQSFLYQNTDQSFVGERFLVIVTVNAIISTLVLDLTLKQSDGSFINNPALKSGDFTVIESIRQSLILAVQTEINK